MISKKYLCIDYGARHVGLAISDPNGIIAMPLKILENNNTLFEQLQKIISDEQVGHVVIGESNNTDGVANTIQTEIDTFSQTLESATGLPQSKTSELYSSRLAKQGTVKHLRINPRNIDTRKRSKIERRIDDKAAAIMLQSFLDALHWSALF